MVCNLKFLICILLFSPAWLYSDQEPLALIEGLVQERGHPNKKLSGNVFVFPGPLKASTDLQGQFTLQVPCKKNLGWVINFAGYQKLEQSDYVDCKVNATPLKRTFFLTPAEFKNAYETIVAGKKDIFNAPKTISGRKLKDSVGTSQDALLGVENVAGIGALTSINAFGKYGSPGTGATFSFFPQLTIQGAEPFLNRFLLDGHSIPFFQYSIKMQSVVPIESVEQLKIYNSGMAANLGRQLGGFLDAQLGYPLDAQIPQFRGRLSLGTMEFAHENHKDKKMQYGFFVRKGTGVLAFANLIYWVLKLTSPAGAPSNNTTGNYISFPDTLDSFMYLRGKVSESLRYAFNLLVANQEFSLKFGSDFTLFALDNGSRFITFLPKINYRISEDQEIDVNAAITYSELLSSNYRINRYDNLQSEKTWQGSLRVVWQYTGNSEWQPRLGLDYLGSSNKFRLIGVPNVFAISEQYSFQMLNPLGSDFPLLPEIADSNLAGVRHEYAHFSDVLWKTTPEISVYLGLRHESFKLFKENYIDPRLKISNKWSPYATSHINWGSYHQSNALWMSDANLGNPDLTAMSGTQFYWVNEFNLLQSHFLPLPLRTASVNFNFFSRTFANLASLIGPGNRIFNLGQADWTNLKNQGVGNSWGFEVEAFFENALLEGSMSYTFSQNKRRLAADLPEFTSPYSSDHIWRTMLSFPLSNRFKIGTRLSLISGTPYSQVNSIDLYADRNRVYSFLDGPLSQKSPWQYQIDLRFDSITYFKFMKMQYFFELKNSFNWLFPRPEVPAFKVNLVNSTLNPAQVGTDQFVSKTSPSTSTSSGANFFNYFPLPSFGVYIEM